MKIMKNFPFVENIYTIYEINKMPIFMEIKPLLALIIANSSIRTIILNANNLVLLEW